ncbi:acyltransferase [Flavobacterium sp. TSSA_36]|uniref:acyltransferase n=1 Tax=Flavobacterium sp. TSSA_36 TaxID=3447669 RepID=UPI003F385B2C
MEVVKKQNLRNSNIELLRIISMTFIVLHHFIYHGLGLFNYLLGKSVFFDGIEVSLFINSFLIIGVNLFVMISGYYLIKFSSNSLVKLYVVCAFYGVLTYLVSSFLVDDGVINVQRVFVRLLFPISYPTYWFITHYVILILLSPLINFFLKNNNQHQILILIFTFFVISVWFGFFRNEQHLNNGYNFINFILIYIIGHYLSLPNNILLRKFRSHSFLCYIICSSLSGLFAYSLFYFKISNDLIFKVFFYNNPLVLLSTIFLFITFLKLSFQNKLVNWISGSILSVYLIQEGGVNFYNYVNVLFFENGYNFNFVFQIIVLILITIFLSVLFDKFRLILTTPIENFLNNKIKYCLKRIMK